MGRTIARFIGGSALVLAGLGVGLAVATHEKDPKPYLIDTGVMAGGVLITTVGPRIIDRLYGRIQDLAIEVAFREDSDEADEDSENEDDQ